MKDLDKEHLDRWLGKDLEEAVRNHTHLGLSAPKVEYPGNWAQEVINESSR